MLGALERPGERGRVRVAVKPATGLAAVFYRGVGVAAVACAVAGAALPILPTTPFLLVALWAFMRASPELAERLLRHPRFGPYIAAWRERRAIPPKAKACACFAVAFSWLALMRLAPAGWPSALVGLTLLAVFGWIITRPH
ncbi:MAG TPA: YbaN family protein [Caulobacteraceae bacterium]|nr:YbaN family protein [Caulobacteraceae bacterium]